MNKRGQVFLLAAIIIIITVITLASTFNFATVKTTPRGIEDLKSDLKKESYEIVDYGIYSNEDIETLLDDFTAEDFAPYFLQKTKTANIVFVYGNATNLKAVKYNTTSTGIITAKIGGRVNWENFGTFAQKLKITETPEGKIIITVQDTDYTFNLRNNEMFYFVIVQEKDDERYIETNQ